MLLVPLFIRRNSDGLFLTRLLLDLLRSNFPILRPSQGTLLRPSGLILVWSSGIVFMMRYAFSFLLSFPVLAIRLTTWTCCSPVIAWRRNKLQHLSASRYRAHLSIHVCDQYISSQSCLPSWTVLLHRLNQGTRINTSHCGACVVLVMYVCLSVPVRYDGYDSCYYHRCKLWLVSKWTQNLSSFSRSLQEWPS